jgi:hypothetical protein
MVLGSYCCGANSSVFGPEVAADIMGVDMASGVDDFGCVPVVTLAMWNE